MSVSIDQHAQGVTSYGVLSTRTAVVTGAASGMGAATARLLAVSGERVALLARRTDALAGIADTIRERALPVTVDITDQAAAAGNLLQRTRCGTSRTSPSHATSALPAADAGHPRVRHRYNFLAFPGEEPPNIECNEDAGEEFIDN